MNHLAYAFFGRERARITIITDIKYVRHVKLAARGPHAALLLVLCGPNRNFQYATFNNFAYFFYYLLNFELKSQFKELKMF
jgi:hypothetical protein